MIYISSTSDLVNYNRTACALTTSWQRFTVTSASGPVSVTYFIIGNDRRDAGQAATPAQTVYVWGGQVEQGAFSTSYIPTTSVSVTRAADVAVMPTNVSWFAPPGGSWLAEFIPFNVLNANARIIGQSVTGGASPLFVGTTGTLSQYDDGGIMATVNTMSANTISKGVASFASGSGKACLNAGAVAVGAMPNGYSNLAVYGFTLFTSAAGGVERLSGYIRRVTYWNRALSDTEMQQVTT